MEKFPPLELLKGVNEQFPHVLDFLTESAKTPEWDERCLVPIGLSLALFPDYESVSFAKKSAMLIQALKFSALAPWRLDKEVFEFSEELQSLLFEQAEEDDMDIPGEILGYLPYRAFYVRFASPISDRWYKLDGFFVHHEWDVQRGGELALRFLFLSTDLKIGGIEIKLSAKSLSENFSIIREISDKNFEKMADKTVNDVPTTILPSQSLIKKALELVLYICSQNADVIASPKQATYKPKRGKIEDRYAEVKTWDVGVRLAPKIRLSRSLESKKSVGEHKTHASPRAHMRRGHWHHYWTGPKGGERKLILKWTAPMLIGGVDENSPAVIHRVNDEAEGENKK